MTDNPAPGDPAESKADLRRKLLRQRRSLPSPQRQQEEGRIFESLKHSPVLRRARQVFCYISYGGEVDTHALIDFLLENGKRVSVPRVLPDGAMQAVSFSGWSDLRPGQRGVPEPADTGTEPGIIDACITPGLGFTESGKRIGYGHGYYDRWFVRHPVRHRIGIAYDCQVLEDLPTDALDVSVTQLVTGTRCIMIDP